MIEYPPVLDDPPPCSQIQAFTTRIMALDVVCRSPPIKKFALPTNLPFQAQTRSSRRRSIDELNVFDSRLSCLSSSLLLKQPPCRRKYQCEAATPAGRAGDNRGGEEDNAPSDDDVDEALQMDGRIPESSNKFVKRVSSRAYDMRRQLQQSMESSSYDVLDANPWRGDSKAVYVLAQGENQLWTMRTRRARSEVERELGLLFPKKGTKRKDKETQMKNSSGDTRFQMLVEDVREGVLMKKMQQSTVTYWRVAMGKAVLVLLNWMHHRTIRVNFLNMIEDCYSLVVVERTHIQCTKSNVFDLCSKMKALAVFFRRGRSHPLPDSLELDLKARKRSLEDQV